MSKHQGRPGAGDFHLYHWFGPGKHFFFCYFVQAQGRGLGLNLPLICFSHRCSYRYIQLMSHPHLWGAPLTCTTFFLLSPHKQLLPRHPLATACRFPTIHATRILNQLIPGRVYVMCGQVSTRPPPLTQARSTLSCCMEYWQAPPPPPHHPDPFSAAYYNLAVCSPRHTTHMQSHTHPHTHTHTHTHTCMCRLVHAACPFV